MGLGAKKLCCFQVLSVRAVDLEVSKVAKYLEWLGVLSRSLCEDDLVQDQQQAHTRSILS